MSRDRINPNPTHTNINVLHRDPLSTPSQGFARSNDIYSMELELPSNIPAASPSYPSVTMPEPHHPTGLMHASTRPPNPIGFECLAITAGVIVTIQFNMLTSGSIATTTTTRALLLFGITFELLAIILVTTFIQAHHYSQATQSLPAPPALRRVSCVPTMLFLMGIVGLAAALVADVRKTSLGTAMAMSGFLMLGIILCVLASFFAC